MEDPGFSASAAFGAFGADELMRCYASQGRTYQALRQYEFCQRILRATIDASPAADTTALYRAIRSSAA